MFKLNAPILLECCIQKKLNPKRAEILAALLTRICPLYQINSSDSFHEFLANLLEECGEFSCYEENLNYSSARLMAVWKKRFPTVDSTLAYVMNSKALATKVYENRADLGNDHPGDGFMFRGSGPIQMTGRKNFTAFARFMTFRFQITKAPEAWAELLRTSDEFGIHSACWIFAISKKLVDEAINDDMVEIVERINGGLTNYPTRVKYYNLCKEFIQDLKPSGVQVTG